MATTSALPHINLEVAHLGFCPEIVQGTPNYKGTADGGSNTTTAVTLDTTSGLTHNNALANVVLDYLQGLLVIFDAGTATAALRGKSYRISSNSVAAANIVTLTVATMPTAPAANDTFRIIGILPAENVDIKPVTDNLERKYQTLGLDPISSIKGLTHASGSFDCEMPGLNTPLSSLAVPTRDIFSVFLETMAQRVAYAGTTVSGGASTATIIDVVAAGGFSVDQLVTINNQTRRITAVDTVSSPQKITLNRALSTPPADTTEVYGAEIFTPYDTGHPSFSLLSLYDDQLCTVTGCVASFKLSAQFGDKVGMSVEFDGEWDPATQMQDAESLDGFHLNKAPIAYIATGGTAFGSTALACNQWEFDLGHERKPLKDDEVAIRYLTRGRAANCKVVFRNKNSTPKTTWEANGTKDRLLACAGNQPGGIVGCEGNAQIGEPATTTDVESNSYYDATFNFFVDEVSNDDAKPRFFRA